MTEPDVAAPADIVVEDNPQESRYEARMGDRLVGIAEYELPDDQGPITFVHTEVRRGGGPRVGTAPRPSRPDDVRRRDSGELVSFIGAWLKRHPTTTT
jgi:hypothetical protein